MTKMFMFNIKVWSFGLVLDFEHLYVGIGLGPAIIRLGRLIKPFDFRITYLCAHCGQFAEVSFWAIEAFDSGTTLKCDRCKKDTIFDLSTPEDRVRKFKEGKG